MARLRGLRTGRQKTSVSLKPAVVDGMGQAWVVTSSLLSTVWYGGVSTKDFSGDVWQALSSRENIVLDDAVDADAEQSFISFVQRKVDWRTDEEKAEASVGAQEDAFRRQQAERNWQAALDMLQPGDEIQVQWRPQGGGAAKADVHVVAVEGDYLRVRSQKAGVWKRRVNKNKVLGLYMLAARRFSRPERA